MSESARISPTAHYTGRVWVRNGLSVDALATPEGFVLHCALKPFQVAGKLGYGGNTLDDVLLQRHQLIDARLREAVERGSGNGKGDRKVRRVLEIAGGLSGRGLRMATGYPETRYVEGDLAGMASRKRRMLARTHQPANHAVVALDALADSGALSLDAVVPRELPGSGPAAIVTEGLLNYFDRDAVVALWRRIRGVLSACGGGVYLADLHVGDETLPYPVSRAFLGLVGAFTRGRMHVHFDSAAEAADVLRDAGFTRVALRRPRLEGYGSGRGRDVVRVIEAWC